MITITDFLIQSRKLIEKEENWCQRSFARTIDYEICGVTEYNAEKWCAWGAISRKMLITLYNSTINENKFIEKIYDPSFNLLDKASLQLGYKNIANLNDSSNHETVLKMYDIAIENSKDL